MTEKMPVTSQDILAERMHHLRELFPEAFTEGKVDFDRLKQALGEEVVEGRERYGLSWAGKSEAVRNIQTPSVATLVPDREESVEFDATENLFIEGDNLEVLKLLQKGYHVRVKMIYIDPPYNRGNDFIYPDNFREGIEDYLRYTGQANGEGKKLSTNTETSGRYHSKWLNMIYPRLFLARNLLREDGVIFVSIDDHEAHNLRMIMDEVFGEENFVDQLIWIKNATKNDSKEFATVHEYLVCYARSRAYRREHGMFFREPKPGWGSVMSLIEKWNRERPSTEIATKELRAFYKKNSQFKGLLQYKHVEVKGDEYLVYREDNAAWPQGTGPKYEVLHPTTGKPCRIPERGWRWKQETMHSLLEQDLIVFGQDEAKIPQFKRHLHLMESNVVKTAVLNNDDGDREVRALVGEAIFEHPKPSSLIRNLLSWATSDGEIVLDFFAGSATTAQAAIDLNKEDNCNRKFIMVQLPEPTDYSDYPSIADISKERIRRVLEELDEEIAGKADSGGETPQDRGFKVFKLASSNFKIWDGVEPSEKPEQLAEQLRAFAENVQPDRSQEDILYEILLKSGLPLTAEVERLEVAGREVYAVSGGLLIVCLEGHVDEELVRGVSELEPQRFVCLDAAFDGNDKLKTNAVLQMRDSGIEFRTV